MSFQGMNTDQVRQLQTLMTQNRTALEERANALASTVGSVMAGGWVGSDAESFGGRYDSEVRARAQSLLERLESFADDLLDQADDQDRTSDADGDPAPSGPGGPGGTDGSNGTAMDIGARLPQGPAGPGGPGAPAPSGPGGSGSDDDSFWGPDWSVGEAAKKIFENIFMPWKAPGPGSAMTIRGFMHTVGQLGGETMPHFFGPLGDAYTGLAGGVERWHQDQIEHPGMSTGTRVGRAFFDGGMNFAGSFLGRVGGEALGTSIGAAVTSETGPGAIGGGAIGGLVGGLVGSYVGNGIFNGIGDSLLD